LQKVPCLRVPKALGEKAIALLRKLDLLSRELKVAQIGDHLYIPLVKKPLPSHIEELKKSLPEFETSAHEFPERTKRYLNLMDVLEDRVPPSLLASLPSAVDFVGEIAVVEVLPELAPYKSSIGKAIMSVHNNVRTVLAKSGAVEGVYRLRAFEVIAGTGETETVHKEHGCAYHVDLAKVYFSPRLSHEHDRVASLVQEGETVVDMFAGVGPFSVLIAKRHKNVQVYAIDVNPYAIHLLKRNVRANHIVGRVKPRLGDAEQIIREELLGVADRVIMNLPERAIEYVNVACEAVKPKGGVVHYYDFADAPNPLEVAKVRLIEAVEKTSRSVKRILSARKVRETSPYVWQVVVDTEIG